MGFKRNLLYNSLLTVSNYLFILISFPYLARVLQVENIGLYNFVTTVVSYFSLLAQLGITNIGIREIARCRGSQARLNRIFSSLVTLSMLFTLFSVIIMVVLTACVEKFSSLHIYFYLGIVQVIATTLTIEWLYKGLEEFKYITVRSMIVKCLYLVSILVFVRTKDDTLVYFVLTVLSTVVIAAINLRYAGRFVHFSLKDINIRPFFRSNLYLGLYTILTSMYTTYNVAYLEFKGGNYEVGIYTTALKVYTVILSLYVAYTTVAMPRISSLLSANDQEGARALIKQSIELLYTFSLPIIIGAVMFSDEIISLIAGPGYEAASPLMWLVIPLLLVVGYAQILVFQIVMPLNKDKWTLYASFIGATLGILSNWLLVEKYRSTGTGLALLITEICVTGFYAYLVVGKLRFREVAAIPYKQLVAAIPYIGICAGCQMMPVHEYARLLVAAGLCMAYFFVSQYYFIKNPLLRGLRR